MIRRLKPRMFERIDGKLYRAQLSAATKARWVLVKAA